MKILTFGQSGQVAQALARTKPQHIELIQLSHQQVDITESQQVHAAIKRYQPDIIINCAAFTNVESAEINPKKTNKTNTLALEFIAHAANIHGIRLIQLSTDYVFDGNTIKPYEVTAPQHALNVYGQSKLLAEKVLLDYQSDQFCIVRTSWLYHHHGKNFVTTLLNLIKLSEEKSAIGANADNPIKIVNDQLGSPTHVDDLGHFIWKLCFQKQWQAIYHWSDSGICTWYQFAEAIQYHALSLGLIKQAAYLMPISSAEYPSNVHRPAFSALNTSQSHFIATPKPWEHQLNQCLRYLSE